MSLRRRAFDTLGLWAVVYPTAMLVIAVIGPAVEQFSFPVRTLITSLVVVTLVTNLTAPLGARFAKTLVGARRRRSSESVEAARPQVRVAHGDNKEA